MTCFPNLNWLAERIKKFLKEWILADSGFSSVLVNLPMPAALKPPHKMRYPPLKPPPPLRCYFYIWWSVLFFLNVTLLVKYLKKKSYSSNYSIYSKPFLNNACILCIFLSGEFSFHITPHPQWNLWRSKFFKLVYICSSVLQICPDIFLAWFWVDWNFQCVTLLLLCKHWEGINLFSLMDKTVKTWLVQL